MDGLRPANRDLPATTLARERVTNACAHRTVFDVSSPALPDRDPGWPVADFVAYLRKLMMNAEIGTYADLSRLTDVSETQLSRWHRGLVQPSRQSLNKLAPVLRVKPVQLHLQAGLVTADDLGQDIEVGTQMPLPAAFDELADLYRSGRLTQQQRAQLVQQIRIVLLGYRAELDELAPRRKRRA